MLMTFVQGNPTLVLMSLAIIFAFTIWTTLNSGKVLKVINNKEAIIVIILEWFLMSVLVNLTPFFQKSSLHKCELGYYDVRK